MQTLGPHPARALSLGLEDVEVRRPQEWGSGWRGLRARSLQGFEFRAWEVRASDI